ncbi:MAG: hypothetical protein V4671_23775 [Armatimonadota bacterium]
MTTPLRSRLLTFLGVALAFVLLLTMYRYTSRYYSINSDIANAILEAQDVLNGNVFLSHWYLTTVTFYTTDVLLFAFSLQFLPFKTGTIHDVNAFIFTMTVLFSVWLAGRRENTNKLSILGMMAAFLVLAFPSFHHGVASLLGPIHMGTMMWIVPALLALDLPNALTIPKGDEGESRFKALKSLPWSRLALASLCLSIALIGDTMTLFVIVLPIALVSLLRIRKNQGERWLEAAILGVCFTTVFITKAFGLVVRMANGYRMPLSGTSNISFVEFPHFFDNIRYTIQGLLRVYNADFFGIALRRSAAVPLLSFVGLCLIFFCLLHLFSALIRSQKSSEPSPESPVAAVDRISAIIGVGMIINVLSYAFGNFVVELMTIRYFVPFVIYSGILIGRYGVDLWSTTQQPIRREAAIAFLAASFSAFYVFTARLLTQPLPGPSPALQLSGDLPTAMEPTGPVR